MNGKQKSINALEFEYRGCKMVAQIEGVIGSDAGSAVFPDCPISRLPLGTRADANEELRLQ